MSYHDNPSRQILINSVDESSQAINVVVEQNENAIWMATLRALNEDAVNYLNSLTLNTPIEVNMIEDSNPPTAINWSSGVTTFYGTVQELTPILTEEGQVCGVVAFGNGFQFKNLRVNLELGNILPVPIIAPVYTYDASIDYWSDTPFSSATGTFGNQPFISKYSGLTFTTLGATPTYISCSLTGHVNSSGDPTNNAATIGAFNFQLSPDYVGGAFAALELHIVAGVTQDTTDNSGSFPTNATITPYYSLDDGNTWHSFTNGSFVVSKQLSFQPSSSGTDTYFNTYGIGTISSDSFIVVNGTGGVTYGTGGSLDTGDLSGGNVKFPTSSFGTTFNNYNPLAHIYCPPYGQDIPLNILADIPYWVSNFKVKLCISGATPASTGGVAIAMMYLYVNFNQNSGYTVNQLITGKGLGVGLVPNFISRTIPDTINLNGIPTQYSTIDTSYVVMDNPTVTNNLIAYVKFPFEDCMTALQDIVKYGSALKFLQGYAGYHWIVDKDGYLIIAPTDNHTVYGDSYTTGTKLISDKWVLQPYSTPLKVKVNMITQQFKTEAPVYNYVYVCGPFQSPLNDNYFRDSSLSYCVYAANQYPYTIAYNPPTPEWLVLYDVTYGERDPSPPDMTFYSYYDVESPEPCIRMRPAHDNNDCTFLRPFNYNNPQLGAIDFTKLMGKNTVPSINFSLRCGGNNANFRLRLYVDDGTGHPKIDTWFEYRLSDVFDASKIDVQQYVTVDLPNIKYQRDYNGWSLKTDTKYSLSGVTPLTIDWSDFAHVAYFGICADTTAPIGGNYSYILMRAFSVNGVVIRAMYDGLSINGGTYDGVTYPPYGVRQTTIKDTFAQADNLDFCDICYPSPNPLTLELIYDLQRYRKVRTTGSISIPLNPVWTAGQQVWIQTEETIPNGYTVHSGSSNPTTSTVGNLGDYYVNTLGSTQDQYGNYNYPTYILTNIVGSTYTWTATGLNQYKINKWMRITKCVHSPNNPMITMLTLTDDLTSSLTVDTRSVYTVNQRANNPDFQSKTLGSLKSKDDFDLGLVPIAFDLFKYMTVSKAVPLSVAAYNSL